MANKTASLYLAQAACRGGYALARLYQPHRLLLERQRASCPSCIRHLPLP